MELKSYKARDVYEKNKNISSIFAKNKIENLNDYELIDLNKMSYLGITGLEKNCPIISYFMQDASISKFIEGLSKEHSYLFIVKNDIYLSDDANRRIDLPREVSLSISKIIDCFREYGGYINAYGEHVLNLKLPSVGIHYGVNLLIGDRTDYSNPLQTTPKSVVDYLGRGSFRGHSSFQVLATSWGIRPEENGIPCNRQFYLVENGKQIFYSALIDEKIKKATCYHGTNYTRIEYELEDSLKVIRTIFLSGQYDNVPYANEVQTIEIENLSKKTRSIKLVYTGMFGSPNPDAQKVDVIYQSLISEARVFTNDSNEIVAIAPSYYPEYCRRELRYCILKDDNGFANEFNSDYTQFVGNGTLEKPENVNHLNNRLYTKGPNFFALSKNLVIGSHKKASVDTFTGVVNAFETKNDDDIVLFKKEISALLDRFSTHNDVKNELNKVIRKYKKYASFLQIDQYDNDEFVKYVNNNLPFQVYYQTFVSRSFAMTQKGYREIGFREIQDLYASMYYLIAQGKQKLLKNLLSQWVKNVYEMGYANHNFYYVGKEPGMCSDDQLWLVQGINRYVNLTGDVAFLNNRFHVEGSKKTRTVYDTLKAIIVYSSQISIGKHNLPLLDSCDWNDCLKIDVDYLNGIEKEKAYRAQIKKNKQAYGVRWENDYSESVMNAFLLDIAMKDMMNLASLSNDNEYYKQLEKQEEKLSKDIQQSAYINDFFARVLINRKNDNGITYVGSKGDKLSIDPNIDGSYYLNSFSWSLLSQVATEKQIGKMIKEVERTLKTPAGFKLCTTHNLSLAGTMQAATENYYVGDRENGGVFKHATMMGVVGMLRASKKVKDQALKEQLLENAYYMLNIVMPYHTLTNPYKYKGNPRLCTQYNNSITEENIGPVLSGTSTWLTLAIMEALGIDIKANAIVINPALKKDDTFISYTLKLKSCILKVTISKDKGTLCDIEKAIITVDGEKSSYILPSFNDNKVHNVIIKY